MTQPKVLYFDYNATTPLDESVLAEMRPYFCEKFGNSVSAHDYGWEAEQAVETARKSIARLLNCEPQEIFFTSGATESNNWAIRGVVDSFLIENKGEKPHLISSPVEHSSLIKCLQFLKQSGQADLDLAKVNQFGQVDVLEVEQLIRPQTKIMSFMWTNNELGSLNHIKELAHLSREKKIYFHTDATQAVGKVDIDLKKIPVDLLSLSAHKIYGPKGVGVLFVRSRDPHVAITPLFFGGGHERGFRSGTINVPGVVGVGKACAMLADKSQNDVSQIQSLRTFFLERLKKQFPRSVINGHATESVPHTINVRFEGCKVPAQIPGIAVSKGSACNSHGSHVSHVLREIGLNETQAGQSLRISIGRTTTQKDLEQLLERLEKSIKDL